MLLLITQFFSSTEREKQITVPLLLSSFRVFVSFAIRRADLYLDCLFVRYPQIVFKAISDSHSRPASFFFFPAISFSCFAWKRYSGVGTARTPISILYRWALTQRVPLVCHRHLTTCMFMTTVDRSNWFLFYWLKPRNAKESERERNNFRHFDLSFSSFRV